MKMIPRRLARAAFAALVFAPASVAHAEYRHGLSIFGDLKYPKDFTHFEYVNPDAPKGGKVSQIGPAGIITFDSFNGFILKGDPAQGLELIFDSLMTRALDEPDAAYGLVASEAEVAADQRSVTFKLRPEAKFADGTPVTADDVVFSFDTIKSKASPVFSQPLRDVEKAEALDPHTVRYTFKGDLVRDLPLTVAVLPIFSKAYYSVHDFEKSSLDKPLGSGPYAIGDYKPGTYVTYTRRSDYWGKDLPVNRGRFNFDDVRYDYFRDRGLELEALKSATIDFREEFTSKHWATGYNIPAAADGRLVRATIPDESPSGTQGFFINTRREKFKDPRVREAIGLAFDFEWSNKNLFYNLYTRTVSYFENSDMKAAGKPAPEELALLEPFRDKLPDGVFDEPYVPAVTDGSGNLREQLRRAQTLLAEAGWKIVEEQKIPEDCGFFCRLMISVGLKSRDIERFVKNAKGERLDVEFLLDEPSFERVIGPYILNLKRIGIDARIRTVDAAQYERRKEGFDFDLITQRYSLRLTPGIELQNYWGSAAAGTNGSYNLAGISDPVVDALAEKVVAAKSRAELVAAARALDRVLRAGHYWIPNWYKGVHNLAYWDKFDYPKVKPKYDRGALTTWWYDAGRSAKLNGK